MRGRESVSSRPTIAPIHRNIIIHGNHHHHRHHRHHQYHHRTARSRFNERTRHRTRFVSRFVSWTVEFAPRFFSSSRPCLMPQKARLQKAAAFRGLSSEKFPRSAAIKHRQPYGTRVSARALPSPPPSPRTGCAIRSSLPSICTPLRVSRDGD